MNSNKELPDALELYQNSAQALATIIDPNKLIVVAGRGTGKTTQITAPRILRVAGEMPRETSIISHKSYIALFTNVIPAVLEFFRSDGRDGHPLLTEGMDYVVGEKNLPKHFRQPRYPILYPERSIVFANGHVLQAVAIDRPDSIAGSSIVHAFFEEMKHSDGEKLRSRIIPAIRTSRLGGGSDAHKSYLHGGITGVSDIGRVSIGEDNWFTEYEKEVDDHLIQDIVTLSLYINKAQINIRNGEKVAMSRSAIDRYGPVLAAFRKKATYYIRVSTFVNRAVLGFDYFKTQQEMLSMSEFLSSICSIGDRNMDNLFFEMWDEDRHTYDDSYKYDTVSKLDLKQTFRLDSSYLKHYAPSDKILIGYDPGSFASMVVAQEKKDENTLRILKEFFVYPPQDIPDLAAAFNAFFSSARFRRIDLYYDRAGNKKNSRRVNDTDAKELKAELEKYGWTVTLKNLGQATIFHWQHHRLWKRLLAENERTVPKIRIDANECPNLVSAMYCCKKVPGSSPVELDKSPEKKVDIQLQAGLTPQIPSAMTYLVWGLYEKFFPGLRNGHVAGGGITNFGL
ncbi:MAG: hypothetical protein IAC08_05540 [Bacteroidetes bacterium]|uniref:Uncharacterized protein n=1 Tax=Candidatus Cryptobacteroides intestinigallinarum TaxID=2840767 RepID=A0A9D9HL51_9BACT|nr:hypothetical protein [Candidatus Cryptobacteroides intestinigallinarum]